MFRQIRFQTGEIKEIINEMKNGKVPCMDVDDYDDMDRFIKELSKYEIHLNSDTSFDKNARDRVIEPEFEFRAAFYHKTKENIMYIDFYFEPETEETYDPIFGD